MAQQPPLARSSLFTRFLDHTQRCSTVDMTSLNEWSARRRDLYLTIHNTHHRQTSMSPMGFEPTISTGEQPQTYVLDRVATGTGQVSYIDCLNYGWSLLQWPRSVPHLGYSAIHSVVASNSLYGTWFSALLSTTHLKTTYRRFNGIASHLLQYDIPRSRLFWELNHLLNLEKASCLIQVAI